MITANRASLDPDFQNLLRGIQIRFARFLARVLEAQKISVPQYNVLATLFQEGILPMNQVAKRLHITKPATTHLVDRLEAERLISRRPDPADRRISRLELTPRGTALVRVVQRRFLAFGTHVLSQVSAKERAIIKGFYRILTFELDRMLEP